MDLLDILIFNKLKNRKGGITPTGSINITENGETDVTNYATANVNVPLGYKPATELTYIESDGTQYINLGTIARLGFAVYLDYQFLGFWQYQGSELDASVGCGEFTNDTRFAVTYRRSGTKFRLAMGVNYDSSVDQDTNRHLFVMDTYKKKIGVDTSLDNWTEATITPALPFSLFARHISGSEYGEYIYRGPARCYGCKLYYSDVLLMDLVPAKDENNVVCMFDKVSGTYKYNNGTGSFIAGSPVV